MSTLPEDIYNKVCETITSHELFDGTGTALACVSGGCDSVAMLLFLNEYSKRNPGINVKCLHFDHMLRGEESDGDREFVSSLAGSLGIDFICQRRDVAEYAKENGISVEMAARECRYDFFNEEAKKSGGRICVAHTGDDKAETILLNIARGTGIRGLSGIRYRRENIVRPFLDISREETEEICKAAGIKYRNDSSNNETVFKRNRVRLEILPLLREKLGEDFTEKILRLSECAFEDDSYIEEQGAKAYREICEEENKKIRIRNAEKFAALHRSVQKRVAAEIFGFFYPGRVNVTGKMMEDLADLISENKIGATLDFTKDVKAGVFHDGVIISQGETKADKEMKITWEKAGPEEALAESVSSEETVAAFDFFALEKYCESKGGKWEIRKRQEGDEITPLGAPGSKTLKKLFIDAKVPAYLRNEIPLLAVKNEILWVPGVRRSEVAAIDKNTSTAIIFRCTYNRKDSKK